MFILVASDRVYEFRVLFIAEFDSLLSDEINCSTFEHSIDDPARIIVVTNLEQSEDVNRDDVFLFLAAKLGRRGRLMRCRPFLSRTNICQAIHFADEQVAENFEYELNSD